MQDQQKTETTLKPFKKGRPRTKKIKAYSISSIDEALLDAETMEMLVSCAGHAMAERSSALKKQLLPLLTRLSGKEQSMLTVTGALGITGLLSRFMLLASAVRLKSPEHIRMAAISVLTNLPGMPWKPVKAAKARPGRPAAAPAPAKQAISSLVDYVQAFVLPQFRQGKRVIPVPFTHGTLSLPVYVDDWEKALAACGMRIKDVQVTSIHPRGFSLVLPGATAANFAGGSNMMPTGR